MGLPELKMINILKDLKENYHIVGLKAEFETEGAGLKEVLKLKEIADNLNLNLAIKIGGCEAVRDMYEAKEIGAQIIIAPMIETLYAMKKYARTINRVFLKEQKQRSKFLINVETITGFNNLDDIINSQDFCEVSGIVLGRSDMVGSLGLTREYCNSKQIFNIAYKISEKMKNINKDFIVGGNVCVDSVPFFSNLNYLVGFETRKIIFDAKKSLNNSDIKKGILKALEFELMWLKNRKKYCGATVFQEDNTRMERLENIIKNAQKYEEIHA